MGPEEIIKTICDWLTLIKRSVGLENKLFNELDQSEINLWPFFRDDWRKSIFGKDSMSNLLYHNLLETALRIIPKQRQGVYLQENMAWEFGLIHAWRTAGHGRITGVPHSTVRFWDMRYFFDRRSYRRSGQNELPMPKHVACNGPIMLSTFQQAGYPDKYLVNLEALRYQHLKRIKSVAVPTACGKQKLPRLLVMGDYLKSNTFIQMDMLEKALSLSQQKYFIIVKPHPNCSIQAKDYPSLNFKVSQHPISELLAECDIAYASSGTSAALDAYCAGVPIVSVLDPNVLNLSPLRGCDGAMFAKNAVELVHAFKMIIANSHQKTSPESNFFTLDTELSRWQNYCCNLKRSLL